MSMIGPTGLEGEVARESLILDPALRASAKAEPWPPARQAWYAVFVFALSLMVNFLDRGILTLLVQPIKRDLHLTDVQISLVMGFAFVLFYVILGLPIARLVDSRNRRNIITCGIVIWSVTTACCGLAQNFVQLFFCRVGVGVGESCSGPSTYSMLSDLFPKEKLPRAIAVLQFGYMAGSGLALIIGGAVIQLLLNAPPVHLPVVGMLHSWQLTFFIVGIPGLLVGLLMMTVKEPIRRGSQEGLARHADGAVKSVPLREVFAFLAASWTTLAPLFLGMGFHAILAFGNQTWLPTFFMRTYGWTAPQIGVASGLLVLLVSPFGALTGSWMSERLAARGRDDANLLVVIASALCTMPLAIVTPLMPSAAAAMALLAISGFCAAWLLGPINACLQVVTPNRMRGQVTALFLFIFNVIGFGLGPTVIALFTDYVFHAESQLRYAMVCASAILGPIGTVLFWLGLKPYARSVARARDW